MKKTISNRLNELKKVINEPKYSFENGISLLKKVATAKFLESVEAHISLNINPKYVDQQLRASLILPHGTGNILKIGVFVEPSFVDKAKNLGAYVAGFEDLLEMISAGKFDFDLLITTPQLMPKLTKVGRILGPKGLMPSLKAGTVTSNIEETINEFKKGKFEYKADKTGIVHVKFGKINFTEKELVENLICLYKSIEKNKPSGAKGKYFKSFSICSTMSPSIFLDLNTFKTT